MDYLFIDYGVRDLSMLVEELVDQTKKVNAGTRDMLITAVSDMTRRSRAIRVNAFGKDATNVISFLARRSARTPTTWCRPTTSRARCRSSTRT